MRSLGRIFADVFTVKLIWWVYAYIFLGFSSLASSQTLSPLPLKLRIALQKYGGVKDFAWIDNTNIVLRTEAGLIFSNAQDSFSFSSLDSVDLSHDQIGLGSQALAGSLTTLNERALMVDRGRILSVSPTLVLTLSKLNERLAGCLNHKIFAQNKFVWVVTDCGTELFMFVDQGLDSKMIFGAGHYPVFKSASTGDFFVVGPRSVELYGLDSSGIRSKGISFRSRNKLLGSSRSALGLLVWTSKSIQILSSSALVRTDHISLESPVALKEVLITNDAFIFRLADQSIFKADQASGRKMSSRIRLDDLNVIKTSPDGSKIGVLVGQSFKFLSYLSNDNR